MEKIPKPILKWVGGKTQIINKITIEYPKIINNYHEIFLGGGSTLFALLSYVKSGIIKMNGQIYAYDLNEELINVYINIKNNHNELYDEIQKIIIEYNSCKELEINRNPSTLEEALNAKENYYYWIRMRYNNLKNKERNSIIGSALFIFLNKTCFRGLFRIGPKGFNVPFGHYKNPEIINKEHLDEISELIQPVIFENCDFSKSLTNVKTDDFIYLDPPYAPENDTSFVKYTSDGFSEEQHNKLFQLCHQLTDKNIKFIMSNADVEFVRKNFIKDKYKINSILCKRAINSKKPDAKTKEVIITNY